MATILEQDDEENQQTPAAEETNTNNLIQSTAPASSGGQQSAAAQAGGPARVQRAPTSSGQYSDIGKYYEAGKDLAQKQQEQVVGGLRSNVQQAQDALGSELNSYKSGVESQRADTSFAGRSLRDADIGKIQQTFAQNQIGGFTSNKGYGDLQKGVSNVQNTNTEAGRMQALKGLASKGYSAGESALDATLLNRAERDTGALASLRQQYQPNYAGQQLESAQQQAQAVRNDVMSQRAAAQQQARDWVNSAGGNLQNAIRQSEAAETEKLRNDLSAASLYRQFDGYDLGDKTAQYEQALEGMGLGMSRIQAGAALSPEQRAEIDRYNALRGITGAGQALSTNQGYAPDKMARYNALKQLIQADKAKQQAAENAAREQQAQAVAKAAQEAAARATGFAPTSVFQAALNNSKR